MCVCVCVHTGRLRMNVSGARAIIYTSRSRSPGGRAKVLARRWPLPVIVPPSGTTFTANGRRRGRGTRAHPALPADAPADRVRPTRPSQARRRRETPRRVGRRLRRISSACPQTSDFRSEFFFFLCYTRKWNTTRPRSVETRLKNVRSCRITVRTCPQALPSTYFFFLSPATINTISSENNVTKKPRRFRYISQRGEVYLVTCERILLLRQ